MGSLKASSVSAGSISPDGESFGKTWSLFLPRK
jgi:hypothetical protein